MPVNVHPDKFVHLLHCSCQSRGEIVISNGKYVCHKCNRSYPIVDDVLQMIDPVSLDADTLRELKGNTIVLNQETIDRYANKDQWSPFYTSLSDEKMSILVEYMKQVDTRQLISLGSGVGYEIKCLLQRGLSIDTVYCSDLAHTVLCVTPHTLCKYNIRLGRFTSNLNSVPVRSKDIPILIYEALHHVQDMHKALKCIIEEGYQNIFLVEPSNNILIKWLAKRGLAQRKEYSGVIPGRLELKTLRQYSKEYGYNLQIRTKWDFPVDYLEIIRRRIKIPELAVYWLFRAFSAITNIVKFGNITVAWLKKR
jgi:hypothetical protein